MATQIPSRLTFVGPVRAGNTVEARWIVGHPMESGFRVDDSGQRIARNITDLGGVQNGAIPEETFTSAVSLYRMAVPTGRAA